MQFDRLAAMHGKYGPKGNLSPSLGDPCPLCGVSFVVGDYTTLARRSVHGKYVNDGVEVHWGCVHPGRDEPEREVRLTALR